MCVLEDLGLWLPKGLHFHIHSWPYQLGEKLGKLAFVPKDGCSVMGGEGRVRQKTRRKKWRVYKAQNQADLLEIAARPLSG